MTSESDDRGLGPSRRTVLKTGGVALAAGLAGCTGDSGGGGSDGGGDGGSGGTTETEGTTTGTAGSKPVTVSFWPAWGGYYETTFKKMVSNFESEYPDITVDMSPQGSYGEAKNAVFSAANAGNAPDVAHLDKGEAIVATDSGFFTPIEEVWPDVSTDDYLGPALGTSVLEGTVWSLPFNNSQIIMYYNKDHFEAAGLDPESPPGTFDEMATAATTIVDEGVADFGVTWPNHSWWVTSWMAEQKQFVCNQQNGRAGEPTETFFTSDATKRIYEFWMNELGDAYHNPGIEAWGKSEQAFQNGIASMHMNSTGSIAYSLAGFKENGINVGVAQLPVPGTRRGHAMGGAAVWVSDKDRTDAERRAIATFLENMTGPEQQALYHKGTGYFPSHVESFDILESEGWFEENPFFGVARDQLEAWTETPMNKGTLMGPASKVYQEIARESGNIMQGKAIDQGLSDLKSFADGALDRYERQ